MKRSYQLAALGCSLPLVNAGSFVWNSGTGHDLEGYAPAQQTAGLEDKQMVPVPAVPAPTSPPELRRSPLGKRASSVPGSVCGYMSHDICQYNC
ncbi:hypothetical protein M406DRAFT_354539 [Cryphonectria parasitica EP155]|uniref:Uncharacterized protein n=1 Tax=Cryphonectria parasitica (strain ATCC 38755 / EP155) TaxID=660469 RepID=A0A9P4YCZ1_CRYP1|nr:uncharacterized protein M406DRAFT_354539 [Cryphonectria parasitica EP155]KAF3770714.1 hypothetical protein M406DRAFT_354539 [Cryphonectria parasitica EP155]